MSSAHHKLLVMIPYSCQERLVILDVDGTIIDAFQAIEQTFLQHGMAIGDLERFQKRRKLLKYLGGLREFPINLRKQFGKQNRKKLLGTLTEYYRDEAVLYPGIDVLLRSLIDAPGLRVALVTRNVTREPENTLGFLFRRHGIDIKDFDSLACIPLGEDKTSEMKRVRERFSINPARAYACGDEYSDYRAAIGAGIYPFIVAYGFDGKERLTGFGVPTEVISTSPEEFSERLRHALELDTTDTVNRSGVVTNI